jgi:squalene synthase HpnC
LGKSRCARTDRGGTGASDGVSVAAKAEQGAGGAARAIRTDAAAPGVSTVEQAYAFCGRVARSHYENFTIASWLMPRQMRRHMHAIYAFARIADDFADEERSIAKIDEWERELELAYAGTPRHPVMVAIADTARRYGIPREPFTDLLVAFRRDVTFQGFETMEDLLGYARYSANPVGRLVLYLFGYQDGERQRLSDQICGGLQLANFWQDIAIDRAKQRIYIPRHDLERFGVMPQDLQEGRMMAGFIALMKHEVGYARDMVMSGAALASLVDRRLRRDILMFAGGGLAILRAIERAGYDVFRRRPRLGKFDYIKLGWHAMSGRIGA